MTEINTKMIIRHHLSYGQNYYYPINDTAKRLLDFVSPNGKRKVFTADQIEQARQLGMSIEILPMDFNHSNAGIHEESKT